jgi:hypothetical protein
MDIGFKIELHIKALGTWEHQRKGSNIKRKVRNTKCERDS